MAVDQTKVQLAYVAGLQDIAANMILLARKMDTLQTLFDGAALSGKISAELLESDVTTKHLTTEAVLQLHDNAIAVRVAITDDVLKNMANAVGSPVR